MWLPSHASTSSSGVNLNDGRDTNRAMLIVQQSLIDEVYGAQCSLELFEGRAWQTAKWVPGDVAPPDDPAILHTVQLDGEHPRIWGHPVVYGTQDAKRPTGLYLAAGEAAYVSVPQAVVDMGGVPHTRGSNSRQVPLLCLPSPLAHPPLPPPLPSRSAP